MTNKVTGHLKIIGSEESSWLGVPTLAEIGEHLIVKLPNLSGDFQPPADTWDLIHSIAKTPAAVTNLMRYYYEPTDEDRLLKRKLPSTFHLNLAHSVSIKPGQIIVTTNRDRLIEWGLARFGITPQVIKNPQDLLSLISFPHAKCTLIKLNGDYLDPDRPQFDSEFKIFLDRQIQQIYEPIILKCSDADRQRLTEFNFELD